MIQIDQADRFHTDGSHADRSHREGSYTDRSCVSRRHLFHYNQADRMAPYIHLGVSDFPPITRDVSDKVCIFVCGQLMFICIANPAKSSFLAVGEFVKEEWQLEKEEAIPVMTFRDAERDECIFNESSFKDALTCTSEETIWFTVHLSWADRNSTDPRM
jgi:hypothetical protein